MDWPSIFRRLTEEIKDGNVHHTSVDSDDVAGILKACAAAAQDMFVDAHNAGYYINSYTTKVNATMDNVLRKIMDGIRNLHTTWQSEVREQSEKSGAADIQTTKRQESFRKALQTLNRLDTSFRRASWKSGCEMLFPILFSHMSFQTHRCWCVFVRRSIWLAAESWRRFYGQMASHEEATGATLLQFQLPQGPAVQLPQGWSEQLQNPGQKSYIDPNGNSYSESEMVEVAIAMLEQSAEPKTKKALQHVIKKHLDQLDLQEGGNEELVKSAGNDASAEGQTIPKATYHGYDQLDDWHYRGTHPILVNMPLYEYSRWVYRVEFSPFAVASAQAPRRKPRHIDIPFHHDYMLGKTWIQRLSREPRVPRIEGMKFHSEANSEMHYLMKSLLLRPIHIPPPVVDVDEGDSRMLRLLHAYQAFCTSAHTQEKWHACGGDGPGPFERSYAEFRASMEKLGQLVWKPWFCPVSSMSIFSPVNIYISRCIWTYILTKQFRPFWEASGGSRS